jgi:hypothetical protein
MQIIAALLAVDAYSIRGWFARQRVAKIFTALGFLIVLGGISVSVFALGRLFFTGLRTFQTYGFLTSQYVANASLLVLWWISLGSSLASSIGMLVKPTAETAYLGVLPVNQKIVALWIYAKVVAANSLLLAFAFLPIHIAFGIATGTFGIESLVRGLFILLAIVFSSTGISFPLAILAVPAIRGREYPTAIFAMMAFFGIMVMLVKLIFPPDISRLYDADPDIFAQLYRELPLNHGYLPSYQLSVLMTVGYTRQNATILCGAFLLFVASYYIFAGKVQERMIRVRSAGRKDPNSKYPVRTMYRIADPIIYKDILSVIRLSSETGYALFITSIAVFLFTFLRFGATNIIRYGERVLGLNLFLFAWILFFTVCIYLRYLFPLVAREGPNAVTLFSLPISRSKYLLAKMRTGMYLALSVWLFSVILLVFMPFTMPYRNLMIVVILLLQMMLSQLHVLLGAISPNFRDGNNSEKVSTSGMGVVALLLSIIMTFLGAYAIYYAQNTANADSLRFTAVFILFGSGLLGLVYMKAAESVSSYQL